MTYVSVPDKTIGDVFTEVMWDSYIRDNLNKGVNRPIAEVTLGAATATIDFTSIAADWSHLCLVGFARGDTAALTTALQLRFNGDTGANYDRQYVNQSGAASSGGGTVGATMIQGFSVPGATATALTFGSFVCWLPFYGSTVNHKTLVGVGGWKEAQAAGTDLNWRACSAWWRSAAALNAINLSLAAGNFAAGTKVTLYGMGAI